MSLRGVWMALALALQPVNCDGSTDELINERGPLHFITGASQPVMSFCYLIYKIYLTTAELFLYCLFIFANANNVACCLFALS